MNRDKRRYTMSSELLKLTEKQKAILDAATDLFAEKGFAGTSTSEIAKKADVAEGTIFKHFKSKKGLLLSVISPMIKVIAPMVKKDLNKVFDKDFEEVEDLIREFIDNRTQFVVKNMTMFRVLIQEIPFHPELKEQFIEHISKDVVVRVREIIAHYQEKGQIGEMPIDSVIRIIVSTVFGHVIAKLLIIDEAEWDDKAELDRTIQFLMKGLAPE
ncbi:TetR family transcriptional regulator [Oceanobacillus chungangensis]|uniref:TetR family transcriptional regulator n=2 Tax=Oceanobacillus chungangensis TaxID=1229152 RepID=A0A3D8PYU7_9BACI|nr:TetR family transcriptional regulator [Oceanobacillus chungangensis]